MQEKSPSSSHHARRRQGNDQPEAVVGRSKNNGAEVVSEGADGDYRDATKSSVLFNFPAHPRRYPEVHSDINCAIVRKFRKNGVEIPFPRSICTSARRFRYRFFAAQEFPRST
jgi:hypothetical protein